MIESFLTLYSASLGLPCMLHCQALVSGVMNPYMEGQAPSPVVEQQCKVLGHGNNGQAGRDKHN